MIKIVRCTCGTVLRDTDESEIVARVLRHAKASHDMELTQEQARRLIEHEPVGASSERAQLLH